MARSDEVIRRRLLALAESFGIFGAEEMPLARLVARLLEHPDASRAATPRRRRRSLARTGAAVSEGTMAGREGDDVDETELARRGFDLPSSGRPLAPPPAPAPEATWDLAWRYGRDLARLHFVDPEKLFFFWEVTDRTAGRAAGKAGKLAARLVRLDGGERVAHVAENVFAVMNWYWECEPEATYRADVGWLGPDGTFESWLSSNVIATPRLSVHVTDSVTWRVKKRGLAGETVPRGGAGLISEDDLPSERPDAAASMAGERRREAAREITKQHWSLATAHWSRTPIRERKG